MKRKLMDLTGERYGKWLVVSKGKVVTKNDGKRNRTFNYWNVICECGTEKLVRETNLKSGTSTNCGCVRNAKSSQIGKDMWQTHGLSKHPKYSVWVGMISRCEDPSNWAYKHYGARGISVAEEWRTSPDNFISWAESQEHYNDERFSLDRIDVNGNYEPSNCRFADKSTQALNRRSNVNNSSGYHGVSRRSNGKWRARITKDGNTINLGIFDKLEDAVEARQIAEIDILGYLADSEPISQKVTDRLSKFNSN